MSNIAQNLRTINERIAAACQRAGRDVSAVKLIVVTKSATPDQIKEVIKLGYTDLGENRVQQLKKISDEICDYIQSEPSLPKKINWHMIGHLQRNKVRAILPLVSYIHSVDTLRLAEEINAAAAKLGVVANILMEVNASGEPQKYGVPVGAAVHLAEQVVTLPNLKLCGLMTMAPLSEDKDAINLCFSRVYELFLEMRGEKIAGPDLAHLSMGMSNDFELAVENGATMLRIGSAIFS